MLGFDVARPAACKSACYMWEGHTTFPELRHGPEFRERASARLEAGWVRRMRHARARLAVIVGTRLVDIVRV